MTEGDHTELDRLVHLPYGGWQYYGLLNAGELHPPSRAGGGRHIP